MCLFCIKFLRNMAVVLGLITMVNCAPKRSPQTVVDASGSDNGYTADVTIIRDPSSNDIDADDPATPVTPVTPVPPAGGVVVPVAGECGDGEDDGEECDDGNNIDGDGCNADCEEEFCGDGIVNNEDENCDDGDSEDGDGCDENCQTEYDFVSSARSMIDVGNSQTCYIAENLWQLICWGSNNQGELGQENTEEIGNGVGDDVKDAPIVKFGSGISAALVVTGGNSSSKFTCVATSAGTLKCFGDNSSGQLGQGDTEDRGDEDGEMGSDLSAISLGSSRKVEDVDAGAKHVCALLDNATVKCFGENAYGQLGQGDTSDRGDGTGEMGSDLLAISLGTGRTASHIATGEEFSCAILDDDSLKCWGRSDSGQLGQGDTNSLGDGANEMGDNLVAISLGVGRTVDQVATGAKHTCALLDDGSVKCFGNNGFGQLGQGSTSNLGDGANEMGANLLAIDLGTGRTATQIAVGDYHTCVLLDNDAVKCFGLNASGQLGQENTDDLGDGAGEMGDNLTAISLGSGRTAVKIAAGGSTTCVILDNDDVKCFGENASGQLGQGNTEDLGDDSNEMGNDLEAIDLGF